MLLEESFAFASILPKVQLMTSTSAGSDDTWSKLRDLKLPREDRMVGGVCTAFGQATPIPAWMWRVAFCTAALAWGGGIIAYIILMICIPDAQKTNA